MERDSLSREIPTGTTYRLCSANSGETRASSGVCLGRNPQYSKTPISLPRTAYKPCLHSQPYLMFKKEL